MYQLSRVYAFTVTPQRKTDETEVIAPRGGPVKITDALREVINNAFKKISAKMLTKVDFELDADRSHPVRDEVMVVAFGTTNGPSSAVSRLAARLTRKMDGRSKDALLLITIEINSMKRRVSMLLLPREDVVQLKGKTEDLLLQLLRDAFSTGAALRKLARLEGHESKTQFLSVEVLDLQLTSRQKSGADFWVEEFLEAKPRLDSATGTRYLVAALQRAFDEAPDDNREAAFAAMLKAGAGTVRKTSLAKYSNELPTEFHAAYFRNIDNAELRQAVFDIDHSVLKTELRRLVITSKDGVIISAPAETVGKSVEMSGRGKQRVVRYSGVVAKERVARGGRSDRS